jgi:sarcosine oxidase subunit alpha
VSGYRLKDGGTLIDRSRTIRFRFEGRDVDGFAGDTLASALLASGQLRFSSSCFHLRPRGVFGSDDDPNDLRVTPAGYAASASEVAARDVDLEPGLDARRRARGWLSRPSALIGAGALSGSRRIFDEAAGTHTAGAGTRDLACDVLVVGGGPAGLMAARVAGAAGLRVVLADREPLAGGRLFEASGLIDGAAPHAFAHATVRDLDALPNVCRLQRIRVGSLGEGGVLHAVEVGGVETVAWRIAARHVVWAAGARERSLIFAGNDLPGVMLASAGLALARRHGVAVGRKVIVFANNDGGLRSALALNDAGVFVKAVVDMRSHPDPALVAALGARGIRLEAGAVVAAARGRRAIKGVDIRGFDPHSGRLGPNVMHPSCDALLVSGGWVPRLPTQGGGVSSAAFDNRLNAFVPEKTAANCTVCGAALGLLGLAECLESGRAAGLAVARACGRAPEEVVACPRVEAGEPGDLPLGTVEVPAHGRGKRFLDLRHDVTVEDLERAERTGFSGRDDGRLVASLGLATSRAERANPDALAVLARLRGCSMAELVARSPIVGPCADP